MRTVFAVFAMAGTAAVGYVTGAVVPPPGLPALTREQPPLQVAAAQPLPQAAQDRPPGAGPLTESQHDVPWYVAHDDERNALRKKCEDDEALARTADCANAEAAANRISAQRKAAENGGAPQWNQQEQKR